MGYGSQKLSIEPLLQDLYDCVWYCPLVILVQGQVPQPMYSSMRISLNINILISLYSGLSCVIDVKTIEANKSTTDVKTIETNKSTTSFKNPENFIIVRSYSTLYTY